MSLKSALERVAAARREVDAAIAACGGKNELAAEIGKLFVGALPENAVFRFEGWAPYFNDGDACIFHLRSPCVYVPKPGERDYGRHHGEDEGDVSLDYGLDRYGQESKNWKGETVAADPEIKGLPRAAVLAVKEVYDSLDEDVVIQAFGRDFVVTIRHDGSVEKACAEHD